MMVTTVVSIGFGVYFVRVRLRLSLKVLQKKGNLFITKNAVLAALPTLL